MGVVRKLSDYRPPMEVVEQRVADLDDGYTRIANELLEAIMSSDFTSRQIKLLLAVVRKTYGFGKKYDWISGEQLSELTGMPRTRCSSTKTELMNMNVLSTDGRKFGINKNIHEWVSMKPARRREYGATKNKSGHIYVMAVSSEGPVKIGFTSRSDDSRLKEINATHYFGHDKKATCFFMSDFNIYAGSIEPYIHELLSERMIKGEIFNMTADEATGFVTHVCNTFKPGVTVSVTPWGNEDLHREGHTKETIQKIKENTPNPLTEVGAECVKPTRRKPVRVNYEEYLDAYNEIVGDRLPHAVEANAERQRKLRKLIESLATKNVDGFRAYVKAFMSAARPFHFGDNDREWVATFDYLLRPKVLTAIREGTL